MITAGMKVKGRIVELVSKDQRLIALHCPEDMCSKGRILAINTMPAWKYSNHGFPTAVIGGTGYHVIEYCHDYPEMCKRFFWYTNSYMSAYREV